MIGKREKYTFVLLAGVLFSISRPVSATTVDAIIINPWAAGARALVQDDATKQSVDSANKSISDAVAKSASDIIDALRSHSGQQTANGQQRIQSDASMRETQDNRVVQQRVEGARYNASLAASSGAAGCNIMTGIVGATGLFNTQISVRNQLNQLSLTYQHGESRDAALRNGTAAAVEERLNAICTTYGTQSMVDEGVCKSVTQSDGNISRSLDASNIIENPVMTLDDQKAARLFIGNAFIPAPLGPVARSVSSTPEGRQVAAARWTSTARNSLPLTVFDDAIALRTAVSDGSLANPGQVNNANGTTTPTTTVRQWAEGTAKGMLGGKPDGQNYPNGISLWAWMDLRAKSFYLDPNFQAVVNKHDMNQNSKDMVLIMGFQTYLQWQQFKQQEKTNVLLASIASMMDQTNTARATSSGH